MRKYDVIYQDLKDKIEAEIYTTGSLLPSENTLQEMYQASRDTVRKALQLLKDDGFIQSQKGRGSIVINRQEYVFPVSGVVSYAELAKQLHLQTRTVVLANHFAALPAKSFKDVDPDVEVKQMRLLKRVRYLKKSRISLISIIWIQESCRRFRSRQPRIRCMPILKDKLAWKLLMPQKRLRLKRQLKKIVVI